MPWLVGTALIHSSIVVEKRDTLKSWTILLAIITFSLSLVGTFLVRSGVLTSVHAFAIDPARGIFILLLLVVAIGGSLTLYAIRAPALKGGGLFAPISREGALVLNNLLLVLRLRHRVPRHALSAVPRRDGRPEAVGRLPVLQPHLRAADGAAAARRRRRADAGLEARRPAGRAATPVGRLRRRRRWSCWSAFYVTHGGPVLAVLGFGLAAWTGIGVLVEWAERVRLFRVAASATACAARIHLPRAAYGMTLRASRPGGLGRRLRRLGLRDRGASSIVQPGGDRADRRLRAALRRRRPRARPELHRRSTPPSRSAATAQLVAVMHPERRFFPLQQQTTSETAIRTNLLADLYVALGDRDASGDWTLRAYWKPLVPWIWIGAVIMAFGGMVSLSDRRWRVGVAARARRAAPAAQPRRRANEAHAHALLYLLPLAAVPGAGRLFRRWRCGPDYDPHDLPSAMIDKPAPAFDLAGLGRQGARPRRAEGPGRC